VPFSHLCSNEAYAKIVGMDERRFKRSDYSGRRPAYKVNLPAQNAAQILPSNQAQNSSKSTDRKWVLPLFIITTLLILLLAGGVVYWKNNKQASPVKTAPITAKSIKVYYPGAQTSEFQADKTSISKNEDAVVYIARRSDGQYLNVSSQNKPRQEVIQKFLDNALVFSEAAESPLGEAHVGNARGYITGSIVTPTTWIIITGSEKVTTNELKTFIKSLQATSLAE
jgi:hypothetical protein